MSVVRWLLAGLVLALLAALLGAQASTAPAAVQQAAQPARHHGVVFVLVDDMRADEMRYLPKTRAWLGSMGTTYTRAYAPTPLCCPARATILSGQYAHNTGVYDNNMREHPGGVKPFRDQRTLATVLHRSGVETGYVGKYLNGYKLGDRKRLPVPPGWDRWRASVWGEYRYLGTTSYVRDGGEIFDRGGYETTVQAEMGRTFVEENARRDFFLLQNFFAPHGNVRSEVMTIQGPIPAPRFEHKYDGLRAPRNPAFNEPDVSDKAPVVRLPLMGSRDVGFTDHVAELRAESLASVDMEMMRLRQTLRREHIADTTLVVLVSDNGYFLGDHRYGSGKNFAYDNPARIPWLMAGPGVRRGATDDRLVGLHDVASTITGWFGLGPMPGADGTSVLGPRTDRDLLLQGVFEEAAERSYAGRSLPHGGLDFTAVRTHDGFKYIAYESGDVELYDLAVDPYEVDNVADDPAYLIQRLAAEASLNRLSDCAGSTCRQGSTP